MEEIRKMKTAVIGCGMISNIYIRNLKRMFSIIDLIAVCDMRRESAEKQAQAYGVEKVMTMEEIAADQSIELVINLTPAFAHYDVIKQMLLAGKNLWTEKVLTTDLEKGRELLRIAEEKGLYLGVAPDTVLGAGVQTARHIIDSGLIGDVTGCVAAVNRNQSLNSEYFRFLQGDGGALPYDVGIYYVAALTALLGPVEEVMAYGMPAPVHHTEMLSANGLDTWQIPGNNLLAGCMKFKSGAVGTVQFNGNTIGEEKQIIYIYGTKGILRLGDPDTFGGFVKLTLPNADEIDIPMTHGYDGKPVVDQPDGIDMAYGHRGIGPAEMAWAIRKNRPNRCSKEFGFHAMEILCGMDEAAATRKPYAMTSTFEMAPLKDGYFCKMGHGSMPADAERSLID